MPASLSATANDGLDLVSAHHLSIFLRSTRIARLVLIRPPDQFRNLFRALARFITVIIFRFIGWSFAITGAASCFQGSQFALKGIDTVEGVF